MLDFLLQIIQFIVLGVILCVFALIPLIMIYLMSESAREGVDRFQMWALRRRMKLAVKKMGGINASINTSINDRRRAAGLPEYQSKPPTYDTVFDQLAAEHDHDPNAHIHIESKDDHVAFFDKIEEYRNGIDGSR